MVLLGRHNEKAGSTHAPAFRVPLIGLYCMLVAPAA